MTTTLAKETMGKKKKPGGLSMTATGMTLPQDEPPMPVSDLMRRLLFMQQLARF